MKRLLLALLVLVAGGVWLVTGADRGLRHEHVVAGGVPLDVVHPSPPGTVHPAAGGRRPGVVVAHGYAGSAELMAPFGDSLAARGYVVVLLDFAGHGANTAPARTDPTRLLQRDLDAAVTHLRSLPDVDPSRIALAGHSMGAGAVTRYAAAHPEVAATVAISLPDRAAATAEGPARLLTLVGALEFPGFRSAASTVAAASADRAVVVVPGVEHITILYAPETHRQTAAWLDGTFGGPPHDAPIPFPGRRLAGTVLLALAFLLGFHPLAALLSGAAVTPWPRWRRPRFTTPWRTLAVAAGATGIGAVAAWLLPADRMPIAIAGYVAAYALISGALLLVPYPNVPGPSRRPAGAALLLLVPYAIVAIALPVHLGMTHAWPVGDRWWLFLIVWAAFAVFAAGADRVAGGRFTGVLAVSAIFVVVLVVAAGIGLTSGFVLLVVVPLVGLLGWQAVWGAILHRFEVPYPLIAVIGSAVVAWPLAVTLPLTG